MNLAQQQNSINQMIQFINQEALEKAEEIITQAAEHLDSDRIDQLLRGEEELKKQYKKKAEDKEKDKKIAMSHLFAKYRVETMAKRNEHMAAVKQETLERLADVHKNSQYEDLIVELIVEGLIRVQEKKVTVRFREMDTAVVEAAIPKAKAQFEDIFKRETGKSIEITLTPDTEYLPGPHQKGKKAGCSGGIELSANNRKIILRNTLDSRLDVAFKAMMPCIRPICFGERPPPDTIYIEDHKAETFGS